MFERCRKGENALLIHPLRSGRAAAGDDGSQEEFADLARSAGAQVAASLTARIDRPNPATLIGSGKLEEVKAAADATGADLILVNHPLSPVQERNLERVLERRVVDRTGLILDIFALRAHSFEGKLQVELAQLKHMATRLVRGWTHLERQRGGSIGLRGPGETQLETDRRLLQKRVEQCKSDWTRSRCNAPRCAVPESAATAARRPGRLHQRRQVDMFNALTGVAPMPPISVRHADPTVRRSSCRAGRAGRYGGFVRDLPQNWSRPSVRPCPKRATPTCCCM